MKQKQSREQGKSMKNKEEPVFEAFRFKDLMGIRPGYYVSILYALAVLLVLYFLFLEPGLRSPEVRLRFHVLAGDASLYVNGRFFHNLNSPLAQGASTVMIPAGPTELRIVKSDMKPWVWRQDFQANLWNNRWQPKTYSFEVRMEVTAISEQYLWGEAWRGYLYRGLEAQKEVSFDASHPYPWVLSEGLRSVLYSGLDIPVHWSADLQRGLASTTSIYQWGDLLAGYSLVSQSESLNGGRLALLGPRSLAILARSAVKRVQRLEPKAESLFHSWEKGMREGMPQATQQTAFWQQYHRQKAVVDRSAPQARLKAELVLRFGDFRFMTIPGQDFALQQTEVSNAQFARFWFSAAGQRLRTEKPREGFATLVLYAEDQEGRPWGWPKAGNWESISQDPSLQEQAVRGITWQEAQAFSLWLNEQLGSREWQLRLPRTAEHAQVISLEGLGETQPQVLNFRIPQGPPNFAAQAENRLGLKGLEGSLWEWHEDDYLPYAVSASANGSSDLLYKAISGGTWLNTLAIEDGTRELWASEFVKYDNEVPVAATYRSIAGQFAGIRSPYTGFRLLAERK